MRALSLASAVGGILLVLGGEASAQIVPHTSDKASAAYSPAAVVQTGSRRWSETVGCLFCWSFPGSARLPIGEFGAHPDPAFGRDGAPR